ncbi:MAG: hypothetical protein RLZZ350_2091, partial [Verrucomicrobiota bacterium]
MSAKLSRFFTALLLGVCALTASAFPINTVSALHVTNTPANFLLAIDLTNSPATTYSRSEIHVESTVYFETANPALTSYDYEVKFRLLNQAGAPVLIAAPGGLFGIGNEYVVADTVVLPEGGGAPVLHTARDYSVALRPLTRLDASDRYHVEMTLTKRVTGSGNPFAATGNPGNTAPQQYYHFTNTIPSGDAAKNVIAEVRAVNWSRVTACKTVANQQQFSANVDYRLVSFDNPNGLYESSSVDTTLTLELHDAVSGDLVPLVSGSVSNFTAVVPNHDNLFGSPATQPSVTDSSREIFFEPSNVLDAVHHTYTATVRISHGEPPNILPVAGNTVSGDPARLLHLSGNLNFGPVATRMTDMSFGSGSTLLSPPVINTFLTVAANGAFVINHPTHIVAGGLVGVDVNSTGDATVTSGAMNLNAPIPDGGTNHNIVFVRGSISLNSSGATSTNLLAFFPTGLGYRFDTNADSLISFALFPGNSPLDGDLAPSGTPTVSANIFICEESKPLWFNTADVRWYPALGEFRFAPLNVTYVRARQIGLLAVEAASPTAHDAIKLSNELLFGAVNGFAPGSEIICHAGSHGESLLSANLTLGPGIFAAHFPVGFDVWFTNGVMQIADDLIVTSNSVLNGVTNVLGLYSRNCADANTNCAVSGAAQFSLLDFVAAGQQLHITRDGGLVGDGALQHDSAGIVKTIKSGVTATPATPVHRVTDEFSTARFCMAGSFLRGDDGDGNGFNAPGQLLFSGVSANNWNHCDRVGSLGYADGFGDYAGFNLRALASQHGVSVIAGAPTNPYPLNARSKYYLRGGGVSGIHEAQFNTVQLQSGGVTYPFSFSLFSLAYLDSDNTDSRTAGNLHIPGVAGGGDPGFDLAFDKLQLTCNGGLGEVALGGASLGATNHLAYWNSDVIAQGLKFITPDVCNPSSALLVLGVAADCALLDKKIYGELGFLTDGNLTTTNDGFTSFLQLPNNFAIHGQASGGDYNFIPGHPGYLNNARELPGGAATGFLDIPGSLDVAFFENLAVNLHTQARTNANAPLYLMAALPDADDAQRGFAAGMSLGDFRATTPHATRDWLAGIHFDYPLKWSDTKRAFRSSAPQNNSFLVLDAQHEVKALDAKNAELTFGIKSEGLPQLDVVNLVADATGIGAKVQNAIGSVANAAIKEGLAQFDDILNPLASAILSKPVGALCDPVSDKLYDDLAAAPSFNWNSTITLRCKGGFGVGSTNVFSQLQNLAADLPGEGNLPADLAARLDKISSGLNHLNGVVDDSAKIIALAQQLISLIPGVAIPPDVLAAPVAQVEQLRNEIHAQVADLNS